MFSFFLWIVLLPFKIVIWFFRFMMGLDIDPFDNAKKAKKKAQQEEWDRENDAILEAMAILDDDDEW